jgi:hypothetical protein
MHPEFFHPTEPPETPRFWAGLEAELRETARVHVRPPAIPPTPRFEQDVLNRFDLERATYSEPGFPAGAMAAIAAVVVATAVLLQTLPGLPSSSGVASPGDVPRPQPVAATEIVEQPPLSAQAMVVASFARFADDRTEVDRLAASLRNRGYEVSVSHRVVPDPSLDGQILEMRHAFDTTGSTIMTGEARGPVVLVVAIAASERPVS